MEEKVKKLTLVVFLCVALLAVASVASAITWGVPDGNEHPYVGTLLFQRGDSFYSCTGTLLTPRVMLTAGHCVEEGDEPNLRTWVSFAESITLPPLNDRDAAIAYLDANWLATEAVIAHPEYNDYMAFPNTYDVGAVILSVPQGMGHAELPPLGLLDTLVTGQGRKDREFTVVGYGMQGFIPPFYGDAYERRKGTVSLIEINSHFTGDEQSAKFTNNPGGGNGSGGTCYGDSGGPVFHGTSNVIGAVVSFGITPCIGVDYQFRIDTPVAQGFINSVLAQYP